METVAIEPALKLWECPACGFTFDAVHEDQDGGYSCPACAEIELRERCAKLEAALAKVQAWAEGRQRLADDEEEQGGEEFLDIVNLCDAALASPSEPDGGRKR